MTGSAKQSSGAHPWSPSNNIGNGNTTVASEIAFIVAGVLSATCPVSENLVAVDVIVVDGDLVDEPPHADAEIRSRTTHKACFLDIGSYFLSMLRSGSNAPYYWRSWLLSPASADGLIAHNATEP